MKANLSGIPRMKKVLNLLEVRWSVCGFPCGHVVVVVFGKRANKIFVFCGSPVCVLGISVTAGWKLTFQCFEE